jgi:hypothetical protein
MSTNVSKNNNNKEQQAPSSSSSSSLLEKLHRELQPFPWFSQHEDPKQILLPALEHFKCRHCHKYSRDFFPEDEHQNDGTLLYARCHRCCCRRRRRPTSSNTNTNKRAVAAETNTTTATTTSTFMVCIVCPATSVTSTNKKTTTTSTMTAEKSVRRFLRVHVGSELHQMNRAQYNVESFPLRQFPDCRQFGDPGGGAGGGVLESTAIVDSDLSGSDTDDDDDDTDDDDDDSDEGDVESSSSSGDDDDDDDSNLEDPGDNDSSGTEEEDDSDDIDIASNNIMAEGSNDETHDEESEHWKVEDGPAEMEESAPSSSTSDFETIELDAVDLGSSIPGHVTEEFARYKAELLKMYSNNELLSEVNRRMGV